MNRGGGGNYVCLTKKLRVPSCDPESFLGGFGYKVWFAGRFPVIKYHYVSGQRIRSHSLQNMVTTDFNILGDGFGDVSGPVLTLCRQPNYKHKDLDVRRNSTVFYLLIY